ncbi:MAG: hypothetical protein JW818_10165 [Pirellulales bacterium]|nr:hypothetical protein [Pirellulales bacterium]
MSPRKNQHGPDQHEPEVSPFETALASLRPSGDRLDHDVVMYQAGWRAGQAAARRRASTTGWGRTILASVVSAVAAGLLVGVMLQPGPTVVHQKEKEKGPTDARETTPERPLDPAWKMLASSPDSTVHQSDENAKRRLMQEERWRRQMQRRGIDLDSPPRGLTFHSPVRPVSPKSQYELLREFARRAAAPGKPG